MVTTVQFKSTPLSWKTGYTHTEWACTFLYILHTNRHAYTTLHAATLLKKQKRTNERKKGDVDGDRAHFLPLALMTWSLLYSQWVATSNSISHSNIIQYDSVFPLSHLPWWRTQCIRTYVCICIYPWVPICHLPTRRQPSAHIIIKTKLLSAMERKHMNIFAKPPCHLAHTHSVSGHCFYSTCTCCVLCCGNSRGQ